MLTESHKHLDKSCRDHADQALFECVAQLGPQQHDYHLLSV